MSLTLYITGQTIRSRQAINNLNQLLKGFGDDKYSLEVIDILDNPKIAEEHLILATPKLVRHAPLPQVRVVGDLSDHDAVRRLLGLHSNYR